MKPALVTPSHINQVIEGVGDASTIGDLIERLQKLGPELPIYVCADGFNYLPVTEESLLAGQDYAVIGVVHNAVIGEAA